MSRGSTMRVGKKTGMTKTRLVDIYTGKSVANRKTVSVENGITQIEETSPTPQMWKKCN